jgi:toxin ParE1/3/4
LKPARLRPQARRDRQAEVRYYRDEAGAKIAQALIDATERALDQLERQPGMGSPALGALLNIAALRTWRVSGFPLLWLYIERSDHLDVIRLLGERQDLAGILAAGEWPAAHERAADYAA